MPILARIQVLDDTDRPIVAGKVGLIQYHEFTNLCLTRDLLGTIAETDEVLLRPLAPGRVELSLKDAILLG